MKIVVLEKMSLGFDVDISFYEEFGEVTYYDTTRPEEIAGRVADADIIIANKAPLNESTIKDAKQVNIGAFSYSPLLTYWSNTGKFSSRYNASARVCCATIGVE